MSLSESEIFDMMFDRLKAAAQKCDELAFFPINRGHIYIAFTEDLKKIEGACRQAALHRQHSPWFVLGLKMEELHKRVGRWMRTTPTLPTRAKAHPLFRQAAEKLREIAYHAEREKTAAVGRLGMILSPEPLPGSHRDTRPVSVLMPSGLLVPVSAAHH